MFTLAAGLSGSINPAPAVFHISQQRPLPRRRGNMKTRGLRPDTTLPCSGPGRSAHLPDEAHPEGRHRAGTASAFRWPRERALLENANRSAAAWCWRRRWSPADAVTLVLQDGEMRVGALQQALRVGR